jgi:hypothetical protein
LGLLKIIKSGLQERSELESGTGDEAG